MKVYTPITYSDLKSIVSCIQQNRILGEEDVFYRGHGKTDYELLSVLSREYRKENDITENLNIKEFEKLILDKFYNDKKSEFQLNYKESEYGKYEKEWQKLFQARHLGCSTRHLDWSSSWERALMFLAKSHQSCFGALWVLRCDSQTKINPSGTSKKSYKTLMNTNPFEIDFDAMINPAQWLPSIKQAQNFISIQQGRFWTQEINNTLIPFENQAKYKDNLIKIEVSPEIKNEISKLMNG